MPPNLPLTMDFCPHSHTQDLLPLSGSLFPFILFPLGPPSPQVPIPPPSGSLSSQALLQPPLHLYLKGDSQLFHHSLHLGLELLC